ncbi:MAG: DUF433 domain-containing protein [Blastocatellia bacterium]
MDKAYVEKRDGGWWVMGTRVSLDSIVCAFRRGASPETIRSSFPVLTLEQVYGAITFYLSRQSEIDEYLRQAEEEYEAARRASHEQLQRDNPELMARLIRAKDETRLAQ